MCYDIFSVGCHCMTTLLQYSIVCDCIVVLFYFLIAVWLHCYIVCGCNGSCLRAHIATQGYTYVIATYYSIIVRLCLCVNVPLDYGTVVSF